jgi:phosphopantetheine--protein transferase-like protein
MIGGAGVDVAPIARVARLVRDHQADLGRIFTTRERQHCEAARPAARDGRYAAAFAAKEAVLKALGTGWRSDLEWSDVDTRTIDGGGAVALTGGVGREAERQGIVQVFVSASITRVCAVAAAVAVLGAPVVQARMLQPLAWSDVVAAYESVRDYTATYDKYERAINDGDLQRINLFFRKPLDVRLEWQDERGKVDQTAVYRQGKNDGKVLARKTGMLGGMLGLMTLDPHGGRAMSDSRHPITEVGIGHIIDEVGRAMKSEQVTNKPAVDDTLDGARVLRVDLDGPADAKLFGTEGARRVSIWIDPSLKLPVKAEVVDAAGRMLERHRFTNLKLNVGLTDQRFTLE